MTLKRKLIQHGALSKYVTPHFNIDHIVCRVKQENWSMKLFVPWADSLEEKGFTIIDRDRFYQEVSNRYATFQQQPRVLEAEQEVCQDLTHARVHTDTIQGTVEIEELYGYYCPTCNKFWREP